MKLPRVATLGLLVLGFGRVGAQGAAGGTENDSLNSLTPAARYAQICPGARDAGTGAIIGRVRDLDDSTALANATVSTQWIDVNAATNNAKGHLSSASTKTNNSGFYLLCGVPAQVRLNLRSERLGYVGSPAQAALDDRLISSVDFALRRTDRAASDTSSPSARGAQKLAAVAIDEKAVLPSWMERSGFEQRRKMGLGAFLTEQDIAKHTFSDFISVLKGLRGIQITYTARSGISFPFPYLLGISDANQVRCIPNVFLDGAPFSISMPDPRGRPQADPFAFEQLGGIAHPEAIKGIEVYSNPGTIPAQYDMTSSTGCGSIVIWTR
jgi:hypothetical protein